MNGRNGTTVIACTIIHGRSMYSLFCKKVDFVFQAIDVNAAQNLKLNYTLSAPMARRMHEMRCAVDPTTMHQYSGLVS